MTKTIKNTANDCFLWLKNYWPCLLIILAIIGFESKSLYNYPIGIMALLGLYNIFVSPKSLFQDKTLKLFLYAFLCLWLPLLISLPDAVNIHHSSKTVLPYLRFFFAGVFIISALSKDQQRSNLIVSSVFIIVTVWCIDASIQFFSGHNLLGFPYIAFQGITGMFYPRNTISHICSILSGFCFFYIFLNFNKKRWLVISLIPLFFIVLLSGRRAAWVMLALSSFGFFIYMYLCSQNKKMILKTTAVITFAITLSLSSTIILHKPTNDRFNTTLGLFSNNFETIDSATAGRLSLWKVGFTIFKSNPVNGIGPRGYRHVFHEYSSTDNYWFTDPPQTHPHLLILEIMAETGAIGLFGYLTLLFFLIKGAINRKALKSELPYLLPVLVAIFPFNAHMAFYGSIWSSMTWLLISLYFANAKSIINNERLKQ